MQLSEAEDTINNLLVERANFEQQSQYEMLRLQDEIRMNPYAQISSVKPNHSDASHLDDFVSQNLKLEIQSSDSSPKKFRSTSMSSISSVPSDKPLRFQSKDKILESPVHIQASNSPQLKLTVDKQDTLLYDPNKLQLEYGAYGLAKYFDKHHPYIQLNNPSIPRHDIVDIPNNAKSYQNDHAYDKESARSSIESKQFDTFAESRLLHEVSVKSKSATVRAPSAAVTITPTGKSGIIMPTISENKKTSSHYLQQLITKDPNLLNKIDDDHPLRKSLLMKKKEMNGIPILSSNKNKLTERSEFSFIKSLNENKRLDDDKITSRMVQGTTWKV